MTDVSDSPPGGAPALRLSNVTKRYPGVLALDEVDFEVAAGSIHALVGENGAGKSTLMKVACGAIRPDSGDVEVAGTPLLEFTPAAAQKAGIAILHQETQIAPTLSVAENLLLNRMPGGRGMVRWRATRRLAAEWLDRIGVELDVDRPAGELRLAETKELEIARALSQQARVLILDEPTAVLSGAETQKLLDTIRRLRTHGVAIVYISHHLKEVLEVADLVTVMRDGRVVDCEPSSVLDGDRLVKLMLGRDPQQVEGEVKGEGVVGEVVLTADAVVSEPSLRGASMEVRAGEIVGIAGLMDSGRRELARCLVGALSPDSGSVRIKGTRVRSPQHSVRLGSAFLPQDRKRDALLLNRSVLENLELGPVAVRRSPIFHPREQRRRAAVLFDDLQIKAPGRDALVSTLSGGNQQKALLARWLGTGASLFVLDEPTGGIDVGTKIEIYRLLRELAEKGKAIVIFSSDYEELRLAADRVLVLHEGKVAAELSGDEITEERLLTLEAAA